MRKEDSGLIDLDALLGAGEPTPSPPSTSTPLSPSTAAAISSSSGSSGSKPPASAVKLEKHDTPDDSLKAVSSAARSDLLSEPPPSSAVASAKASAIEASPASRASMPRAARKEQRRSGKTLLIAAAALGLVAVLGGVAMFGRRGSVVDTPPRTAAAPPPIETAPPAPVATAPAATETKEAPAEVASATPSAKVVARAAAPARSAAKEEAPGPAKLETTDLAASAQGDPGDLGHAMRDAVGARKGEGIAAVTTESNANARQVRPSPGAVVGAIGAVLPSARACLEPDDGVRTGEIIFKNDGSVVKVVLRGEKASDGCVRAALSKARIEPFVDDTFTARVTVRP